MIRKQAQEEVLDHVLSLVPVLYSHCDEIDDFIAMTLIKVGYMVVIIIH
jgi:hypothetical protein